MVELLINVYIVLNFCQLKGLLLWWKSLAGSMMVLFSHVVYHYHFTFAFLFFSLLLISLKRYLEFVSTPPPTHPFFSWSRSSFLKTGNNLKDRDKHIFSKILRCETPSLSKGL